MNRAHIPTALKLACVLCPRENHVDDDDDDDDDDDNDDNDAENYYDHHPISLQRQGIRFNILTTS
jgi:hypothetical protein